MAGPNNVRGVVIIVAITAAVFVWLSSQRPGESTPPSTTALADESALPGFRADAWFLPDDELLGFVEIAGGPFRMGSDSDDPAAYDNERWTALVEVPRFYIGRFEVTVAQFQEFIQRDASTESRDHPVADVSWPEALAYCRWLESNLRRWKDTPPALARLLDEGWHVTLPTEAQWEKAARGTDARTFPWGDEPLRSRANFESSGTTPVGSFECPECANGLSDMSGNVWELTRSPYRDYPYDPSYDDVDLDIDALWVMRGGSYADPARNIRTTIRGGADPGARRPFIGFRVALVPE